MLYAGTITKNQRAQELYPLAATPEVPAINGKWQRRVRVLNKSSWFFQDAFGRPRTHPSEIGSGPLLRGRAEARLRLRVFSMSEHLFRQVGAKATSPLEQHEMTTVQTRDRKKRNHPARALQHQSSAPLRTLLLPFFNRRQAFRICHRRFQKSSSRPS